VITKENIINYFYKRDNLDKNIKVNKCWYSGGELRWNSDFNYDEVYGEGEEFDTILTCMNYGAEVQ
jgi:hypothetical protein